MRRVWILLPAALLLSACGGKAKEESSSTGPPLKTISVSEKEYSISPNSFNVSKPGTYSFQVTNNGQIAHALEIEGQGVEEKTDNIDPGSSATLTVDLSKGGDYEVYCPIDGHKDKGMKASLTVGGSAGGGQTTTSQTTTEKPPGY